MSNQEPTQQDIENAVAAIHKIGAMIVPLLHSLNQKMQPIVAAHLELERRRTTKTIQAIEEIREDPDDCKDYEDNYRAGWTDACNAILDHLNAESISTRQEH